MTFTLDTSTLAGGQFRTVATTDINGEFREIQFSFTQAGLDEDMEPHFWELHYKVSGVSHEASS
jgi:hypothetical protein